MWSPAQRVVPEPYTAGAQRPANPCSTHPKLPDAGPQPGAQRSASAAGSADLGDGSGWTRRKLVDPVVVVLYYLKNPLDFRACPFWSADPLPPPSP